MHWATFNLAFHPWAEPVRRLLAAGGRAGVPVVVPRPGGRVDVLDPPGVEDWWTAVGSVDDLPASPAPATARRRRAQAGWTRRSASSQAVGSPPGR